MYGSDYLFPVLLARKSGGGGGQPTFNYGASLSMTIDSSTFVVTAQLLDQNGNELGQAQTIDLPLESVVVGGSYDDTTKKVVLTLQNGNTVEFSVADLVSGLQTELSATNKLNPAYINYDSTHAAVTEAEKTSYAGKQDAIDSTHKLSADLVDDSTTTNKFVTATDKTKLSRVIMDSTESQDYYLQNSTPTNPSDGDYWFDGSDLVASDITAMTGYAKASAVSAISTSDTLNQAMGKLEKKADDNTTSLSSKQNQVLGSWTAGTATTHSTPASTDTVLQALEKIDNNQRLDETNILSIDDALGDYVQENYQLQTFELGTIDSLGNLISSTTRIRTTTFLNCENLIAVSAENEQLLLVAWKDNQTYGDNSSNTPGGWSGTYFGRSAGKWLSDINIAAIRDRFPTYKFGLCIRYADNRTIDNIQNLLSTITFVSTPTAEHAIDDLYSGNEVIMPFGIAKIATVYKYGKTYDYKSNISPIAKTNGVTVFVSPTGSGDGTTINTPMASIDSAIAVTNVQNIVLLEGTYTAGTNFTAGLQITTPVNVIGVGTVVIDNGGNNAPLHFKSTAFIKNVSFKHGNNTVKATLTANDAIIFDNCEFAEADTNNGLAILGGKALVVGCKAHDNAYDGFNYHANNTVINQTFEINCTAYNNGKTDLTSSTGQSSNASTAHDGSIVIRVNGDYYNCHGGIVADLQSYTANYACKSGISTVTDANYPDRMSNYWCSGGLMYLYDCDSYGSKYDTAKISNGVIKSNIDYPNNYTD